VKEEMSSVPKLRFTPEQYLALERQAEYKSEFLDGEIFAMAGASREHNLIAGNVFASLHGQLRGRPSETYPNDMRIKVTATGLRTYPDVVVVCGEPQFEDENGDTLLNPTLLVEVLSRTTEAYDRGEKFAHYRLLESLVEYVLIAQNRCQVERLTRQPDGQWLLSEARDLGGSIALTSIGSQLALAEVYGRVKLPAGPRAARADVEAPVPTRGNDDPDTRR
jgi:Uma2 family endonuclease